VVTASSWLPRAHAHVAGVALGWQAEVRLEAQALVEADRPLDVAGIDDRKGSLLWRVAS
jgi:hypothetical protein